jgi:hypothetical protein
MKMTVTQSSKEKIEMIETLTAGNKVKFQYVDRKQSYTSWPVDTSYEIDSYAGEIIEVRDTEAQRLAIETVSRHPEIERSRFLIKVKLDNNQIKSFYSGRVVNVEKINKSFLKKLVDKLTGK